MQYLFMNNLMPFCIHVTRGHSPPWPMHLPSGCSGSAPSSCCQRAAVTTAGTTCHRAHACSPCSDVHLPLAPCLRLSSQADPSHMGVLCGFVPWPLLNPACLQVPQKPTWYLQITFYSGIKWINSLCQAVCTTPVSVHFRYKGLWQANNLSTDKGMQATVKNKLCYHLDKRWLHHIVPKDCQCIWKLGRQPTMF